MSHDDIVRATAMSIHCLESKFQDCEDSATMAAAVNVGVPGQGGARTSRHRRGGGVWESGGRCAESQSQGCRKGRACSSTACRAWYPLPQTILAGLYERGHGVEQNFPEAARLYRAAAGKGHAEAQVALAAMYERGQGVPENPLKALMWFTLAREAENPHGAIARVSSNRLRRVMAEVQASQVDEMVMRCSQSKFQDCD
jgi:hypothetical protein